MLQKVNPIGKTTDVAQAISEQITQMCDCEYSESFIDNGQFFCSNSREQVIYQAQLLTTDRKTVEEIRNLIQEWVLTKPFVTIDGQSYQLDPHCSVVIREIGDLSCDPTVSALLPPRSSSGGHLVGYSVGIILVLSLVVGTIILAMIIAFYTVRRYRSKKVLDATRYEKFSVQFKVCSHTHHTHTYTHYFALDIISLDPRTVHIQ